MLFLTLGLNILCGNSTSAASCPANSTCLKDAKSAPGYGFISFDSIESSLLITHQVCVMLDTIADSLKRGFILRFSEDLGSGFRTGYGRLE